MTDEELMQQIKHHPNEGIDQAIKKYGPLIKGVIIKIAGNEKGVDVQECMSQVFIRLWKYGKSFDVQKGSLRSYIVTIARNETIKAVADLQKRKREQSLENYDLGIDVDMTNTVTRNINRNIIHETVKQLKEPDRQIFIRRYFWGERIKSIAIELELDEKFVENRIYLVKKKMREQLIERGIII